jgi:Domain of unknown function (DUF4382)
VRQQSWLFVLVWAIIAPALLIGCGGGRGLKSSSGGAPLALTVSSSATCGGPGSSFSHIYVTIRDVQISPNANATPGDGSFIDLTPGLSSNPQQIDLMGTPNQCFLSTLGSNLSLNPGTYAQLRVVLASDGTNIQGNKCGLAANCVTLSGDPLATPHAIQVGSETTTGIEIPSNNIAGGSFRLVAGQQQNLNVNFDACASVVTMGGNQFRLEAMLFAGDTGASSPVVNGQLVDSATTRPVPSGQFTVALEQLDSRSIDRVMMETGTDAQGNFQFCPVPAGHYDVVASGMRTDTNATYGATATLSVPGNTNLGQVPMTAVSGNGLTAAINGSIDISGATPPSSVDITVSALQLIASSGLGGTNLTVPLLASPSATASIATPSGCISGMQCAPFSIALPAATPVIGQFNSSGTTYNPTSGQVNYSVEGDAFIPLTGGTPDCSPSFQSIQTTNVTPGASQDLTSNPLSFSGCQ